MSHQPLLEASGIAVTVAESVQPKRIDYLWPGRIARGKLTVIGGDPGVGKGTLGIDICARLSTGSNWPDGKPAPQGMTQLLTGEDDPADTIKPRLMVAGADCSQVLFTDYAEVLDRGNDRRRIDLSLDAELLVQTAAGRGVVAIVIDPLSSYLGQETNSWRDSDMRRVLDPLAEAAGRSGVAIVLVAHLTKASGNKALYRFQGSIATTAAARFGFLVAKHTTDPELRVFAAVKSNFSRIPTSLSFRIVPVYLPAIDDEVGKIEWAGAVSLTADDLLGPQERSRAVDTAKDFLLNYLAAGEAKSNDIKAAAHDHGIGQRSLWDARTELEIINRKDGLGQWFCRLPDRHSSPQAEPLRPDRHSSTQFNSNGAGSHGSDEYLSIYRSVSNRVNHVDIHRDQHASPGPGFEDTRPTDDLVPERLTAIACAHPNVRATDDLLTCLDCGWKRHPSEDWPTAVEVDA
jgi:putative DNA primase/helicase